MSHDCRLAGGNAFVYAECEDSPLNQRPCVDLVASLGQNGVLESDETARVVTLPVRIGADSESLRALSAGVHEVDVVDLEVWRPGSQSGGGIVVG